MSTRWLEWSDLRRAAASRLRLGLQRRILAYAAIGLGVMFAAWSFFSLRAVDRISTVVFDERLATTEVLAASIAHDLELVALDVSAWLNDLEAADGPDVAAAVLDQALAHLRLSHQTRFFELTEVILVGPSGEFVASAPADAPLTAGELQVLVDGVGRPVDGETFSVSNVSFGEGTLAVTRLPVPGYEGAAEATAYVVTRARNATKPLSSLGTGGEPGSQREGEPEYYVQILNPRGVTVLNVGGLEQTGQVSYHWPAVEPIMRSGRPSAVRDPRTAPGKGAKHVLATAAIAGSDMWLVLEQEVDPAANVPSQLRTRLILIGLAGFAAALGVAWITTRRVVRPTLDLTAAAGRIADGDLDSPVQVVAQDEIGRLAESLEVMRQQLAQARTESEEANRVLESNVRERTEQLREALRRVISAQEEERGRLARELHDEVTQELVILARGLDELSHADEEGRARQIERLGGLARGTLATVRQFSQSLRPPVLDDLGLVAALGWLGTEAERRSGLQVHVSSEGSSQGGFPRLAPEVELALFRIAQEAVRNVERHAGASRAEMILAVSGDTVTLTVRDDGRGFRAPARVQDLARTGKLGLLGMTERAELAEGSLDIGSRDGAGVEIVARLPVRPGTAAEPQA
ncbi:MAG: HAMP domain-containing protein [Dehalococcoidia bacterium]